MDLELTTDQVELRGVAAQVLDRHAPLSLARRFLEGEGAASALWAQLAELGWYAVGLEADDPFGVSGLCLLAEQVGRHAAPTLLADTALTARVALAGGAGGDAARVAEGGAPCALALLDPALSWDPALVGGTATSAGDDAHVTGVRLGVHHAAAAEFLAVLAPGPGGPGLYLVDPRGPGVALRDDAGLDASCAAVTVVLDDAPAQLLSADAGVIERALAVGAVATAAEGIGAASAALDLAIAYALERVQYGREIGRFQALQHLMAEMHVLRETAWSTTFYAAAAIDEDLPDRAEATAIAKAHAARSARTVVEGAMQVLGGIGFTWEHDHHLLHRRVLECEQRFGDALHHERRIGLLLARRALGDGLAAAPPAVEQTA